MPWSETSHMRERMLFVAEAQKGVFSVSELCESFGISRKTGYKWIERFEREGLEGLKDRPRIARECPHRTIAEIAQRVLEFRRRHPRWGPKKLLARLEQLDPSVAWPAPSTAGELLKRAGLIGPSRHARRKHSTFRSLLPKPDHPNDLWTADFKGQFKTRDAIYCYPLTIADGASRFLLEIRALDSTDGLPVYRSFQRLFHEHGLPRAIRTDNGTPFAGIGLRRLSRLSVWWIRLGIHPQLIAPSHPEQNGAHERMHKTLKADTARPPQANRNAQQRRFDHFRQEYNHQRPHEALGQKTPASLYQPSPRPYPSRLAQTEYPGHFELRRVGSNGCILFQGQRLFLSSTLSGQIIGLEESDNDVFSLSFGSLLLARLDLRTGQLHETITR
jgi:putative transposase